MTKIPKNGDYDGKHVVRLWDMFDGWMDISEPIGWGEALAMWNDHTDDGSKNTSYGDGDYYDIYPADTKMLMTPESMGRD